MQLESLSLFLAVIESGSITKAAQRLYITPQGASSAIKTLEKQIGVTLFERKGQTLELTPKGSKVAQEAEKIVNAYQRLQEVIAFQDDAVPPTDTLNIVATPFVRQTFTSVLEDYAEITCGNPAVSITEQNAFEIVRNCRDLDTDTLYLVDIPLNLEILLSEVSEDIVSDILTMTDLFMPFALSTFLIKCSEFSSITAKESLEWSDIAADKIACHDDPFLMKVIGHFVPSCNELGFGMKVTDTGLISTVVQQSGMIGISASLPVIFRERTWKRTISGSAVIPKPKAQFVTGVLGSPDNKYAANFHRFMRSFLDRAIPEYMKENDPAIFFEQRNCLLL